MPDRHHRLEPAGHRPGAPTAAWAILTIVNHGAKPDRLVSADTPVAPTLGLHSLTNTGGVMRMRAMPEGLAIRPARHGEPRSRKTIT